MLLCPKAAEGSAKDKKDPFDNCGLPTTRLQKWRASPQSMQKSEAAC